MKGKAMEPIAELIRRYPSLGCCGDQIAAMIPTSIYIMK